MTKIIAILQLTVPTVLLIAPFLYRRKFRPLVRFCIRMAIRQNSVTICHIVTRIVTRQRITIRN